MVFGAPWANLWGGRFWRWSIFVGFSHPYWILGWSSPLPDLICEELVLGGLKIFGWPKMVLFCMRSMKQEQTVSENQSKLHCIVYRTTALHLSQICIRYQRNASKPFCWLHCFVLVFVFACVFEFVFVSVSHIYMRNAFEPYFLLHCIVNIFLFVSGISAMHLNHIIDYTAWYSCSYLY